MAKGGVSICVPVFGTSETLLRIADQVAASLSDRPYEIIFVDDGSPRETWDVVRALAARDHIRGIRLSRNVGQHSALLAGVRAACHGIIVTLDDDLQNPPEEIPKLLALLDEHPDIDLVYGTSPLAAHRWWRRAGSAMIRVTLAKALATPGASHIGPFRAFRTRLRDGFALSTGPGVSVDALLAWSTDRVACVEVEHHERQDGRSGYSFRRLRSFAFDVITGYSTVPLRLVTRLGFISSLFGLAVLVHVIGRYLVVGTTVAGFPVLASIVALFSGAQMLSLGIIGEYLGRTHVRVTGQPAYVIAEQADGSDGHAGAV